MLTIPPPHRDLVARFVSLWKVDDWTGCWTWTGFLDRYGYGRISLLGEKYGAHRVSYTWSVGPIPDDLVIDHLCRNRACVNPAHMEPVTVRINTIRGDGAGAYNTRKTHCPQGHPYDGDNLLTRRSGRGCKTCTRARAREWKARSRN